MKRESKRTKRAGVTLIEMLVVVTIIALFVAVVGPSIWKKTDVARQTAARAQMHAFLTALGTYKLDTGLFPSNEQGLQALRAKPPGVNNWQGPYLTKEIGMDPWGKPYAYKYPSDEGDEPEIVSWGADGQPGGEGINADIVSWKSQ